MAALLGASPAFASSGWVTVPAPPTGVNANLASVSSPNGSTGPTVLDSVSTTPEAAIVQAVGTTGVSGANSAVAIQNG
jgi:hypothetical protein